MDNQNGCCVSGNACELFGKYEDLAHLALQMHERIDVLTEQRNVCMEALKTLADLHLGQVADAIVEKALITARQSP